MESNKRKSPKTTVFYPMKDYIIEALKGAEVSAYSKLSFKDWWNLVESNNNNKRKEMFRQWAEEVFTQVIKDFPEDIRSTVLIGKSWNQHKYTGTLFVIEEPNPALIRSTIKSAIQKNWLHDRIVISTVDSFMSPGLIENPQKKIFAYFCTFDDGNTAGYLRELVIDKATLTIEKVLSPA